MPSIILTRRLIGDLESAGLDVQDASEGMVFEYVVYEDDTAECPSCGCLLTDCTCAEDYEAQVRADWAHDRMP